VLGIEIADGRRMPVRVEGFANLLVFFFILHGWLPWCWVEVGLRGAMELGTPALTIPHKARAGLR
jgi:hypothetical protein